MGRARQVRFGAGTAIAAVGATTVALIDGDPLDELTVALADAVVGDASFEALVGLLLDAGAGALPDLAVAQFVASDRSVRTLVRGGVVIELAMARDLAAQRWDATGVTTWTERRDVDVAAVTLRIADDLSTPGPFRVGLGVVPAGVVAFDLDDLVAVPAGSATDSAAGPAEDSAADSAEERADQAVPLVVVPPSEPSTWVAPAAVQDWTPPVVVPDQSSTIVFDTEASDVVEDGPDGPEVDQGIFEAEDDPSIESGSDAELDTLGISSVGVHQAPDAAPSADLRADVPVDGPDEPDGEPADDPDDEFDHLFGATQYRPVSAAGLDDPDQGDIDGTGLPGAVSVGLPSTHAGDPEPAEQPLGDHDGMTISLAQLRALAAGGVASSATPAGSGPMVHAVECVDGHLNPPSAVSCRACGVEIPAQAHASVPRPRLGRLVFSHGEERLLDGPLLLGRSPKADGPVGSELPELVVLPSPTKELSGTHLEVRLEGWQVVVVDRRSTNGTTVQLPLTDPQRLHPGEPFPIVPGTIVDLAEEIQFTFEVDP